MESDEDCPSNNKQMDKQELLFVDDNPAPNNPYTWLFVSQLTTTPNNDNLILKLGYSKSFQCIALYLTTLQKPTRLTAKKFRKFKNHALHFRILDKHLFRRNSRNVPCRRVIDNKQDRQQIMQSLHNESNHQGREKTYRRVADRY